MSTTTDLDRVQGVAVAAFTVANRGTRRPTAEEGSITSSHTERRDGLKVTVTVRVDAEKPKNKTAQKPNRS